MDPNKGNSIDFGLSSLKPSDSEAEWIGKQDNLSKTFNRYHADGFSFISRTRGTSINCGRWHFEINWISISHPSKWPVSSTIDLLTPSPLHSTTFTNLTLTSHTPTPDEHTSDMTFRVVAFQLASSLYGWRFPLPYCSGTLVKEPPPSPLPLPPPPQVIKGTGGVDGSGLTTPQ